jgi:hypothetical protein
MSNDDIDKERLEEDRQWLRDAWENMTPWQRKEIYYLTLWYVIVSRVRRYFEPWTLPAYAIRQIANAYIADCKKYEHERQVMK